VKELVACLQNSGLLESVLIIHECKHLKLHAAHILMVKRAAKSIKMKTYWATSP